MIGWHTIAHWLLLRCKITNFFGVLQIYFWCVEKMGFVNRKIQVYWVAFWGVSALLNVGNIIMLQNRTLIFYDFYDHS